MRDQTCSVLLANGNSGSQPGSARAMVKNWTPLRWVLVGTIVGLAVLYGVVVFFQAPSVPDEDNQESTAVVIAKRYIAAFTIIHPDDLSVRSFPKGFVPPGAFHAGADFSGTNALPVFASEVAIPEGQPVTRALITELGKNHGMASILAPGKVAVSFSVDAVRGVGGWIQPGDTIAVFSTSREGDLKTMWRHQTHLLFSDVHVLAVDKKRVGRETSEAASGDVSTDSDSGGSIITVLMNPLEAARLVEARESGKLSALLRALGDESPWVSLPAGSHE